LKQAQGIACLWPQGAVNHPRVEPSGLQAFLHLTDQGAAWGGCLNRLRMGSSLGRRLYKCLWALWAGLPGTGHLLSAGELVGGKTCGRKVTVAYQRVTY